MSAEDRSELRAAVLENLRLACFEEFKRFFACELEAAQQDVRHVLVEQLHLLHVSVPEFGRQVFRQLIDLSVQEFFDAGLVFSLRILTEFRQQLVFAVLHERVQMSLQLGKRGGDLAVPPAALEY